MTFIWPWMLLFLLLVPLLMGGYKWLYTKKRQSLTDLGPLGLVQNRAGERLGIRSMIPLLLYLLGISVLLFSLSRPEVVVDLPRIEGTVILAFDVSNSMAADDFTPTRMEAAKTAARNFVENQPGTIQLGVVAFSNGGLVVQPPTDDQAAVLDTIDRLNPQGATSLGQGIFSALNAIAGEAIEIDPASFEEGVPVDVGKFPSAVVLLLTDGENTSNLDPLDIAQIAAEAGVRIYPVGIGSQEGAILQIEGYNVSTRLDESMLQDIASLTNGSYYRAEDEESLHEVYENVDLHLTISGEKTEVTAIFAGLGLLFFLLGGVFAMVWFGRMPL
jgi:Ca-activated chloride channel family protein